MKISSISLSFIIGLCAILMTIPAHAQIHTAFDVPSDTNAAGHVTVIVLDMSGSMATNDPDGLRCSAANAYIDLSGPGNFIGIIGLDNNNNATDAHGFQMAQIWAQPTEMATLAQRQGLQQTIVSKSNSCRPDNTTPTYDALNEALGMLTSATQGGKYTGSVILLTDGTPDPQTNDQINAINHELLPQFQQHNWPVDTVALGQDGPIPGSYGTFHSFLSGISDATSGKFYDDGKGAVPGVSPLNIAPFFVDIFARRNGRTLGPTIGPTSLNGGTTSRNFQLGNYVDHLDVLVVKDQPATKVTLTTPAGQTLPPEVAGTFVSTNDPHYAIFSIDGPQTGVWQVNVSGSGEFVMDSLVVSTLNVSIIAPTARPALPLGQEFNIGATINNKGTPVTGGQFTITGKISYVGEPAIGTVPYSQDLVLTDSASPGTYQAKLTIPQNASPGAYDITVSASQVSSVAISSDHLTIRLELFPLPFFLSPQTGQATGSTVKTTVIQWDPVLQFIYGLPVGFLQQIGQLPLQNLPARPLAALTGQVRLKGNIYPDATVTAVATRVGSQSIIPVTVINDGSGRFHVQFPPSANGTYQVTFRTSGSFEDSHGDFGTTTRMATVVIQPATGENEGIAWLITAAYLLVLFLIIRVFVYFFTPRPFGEWVHSEDGDIIARQNFNQSGRGLIAAFFHRNTLTSTQAGMPAGLRFRFSRGNSIETQAEGHGSTNWKRGDGREVQPHYQETRELIYSPDNDEEPRTYTIMSRAERRESTEEEEEYI